MQTTGTIVGIAPYTDITDDKTGEVSSGLSVFYTIDGEQDPAWIGLVPQKDWLKNHNQVPFFLSPEGKKTVLPRKAKLTLSITAKKSVKLSHFEFI